MKKFAGNQKGFTLIELIMVIVILGILAAVAVPKFVDLQADSKKGVAHGITGALGGAITMLHSQYLLLGTTYDATSVVSNIDTAALDGLSNGAAVVTATVKGDTYTWTYTARSGVTAAKVAEGF